MFIAMLPIVGLIGNPGSVSLVEEATDWIANFDIAKLTDFLAPLFSTTFALPNLHRGALGESGKLPISQTTNDVFATRLQ